MTPEVEPLSSLCTCVQMVHVHTRMRAHTHRRREGGREGDREKERGELSRQVSQGLSGIVSVDGPEETYQAWSLVEAGSHH